MYFSSEELKRSLNNSRLTHKSLIHFNIRSLSKNYDNMIDFFSNLNNPFTIICLSEVWLTNADSKLFGIPGYTMEVCVRKDVRYGGSAILVQDNHPYHRRHDLSFSCPNVESVFLEFDKTFLSANSRNTIIGSVYRSPSSCSANFCSQLDAILNIITNENKNVVILGDINIDITNPNDSHCSNYTNCYAGYGLDSLITVPTRCPPSGSHSLIDHVLSNLHLEHCAGVVTVPITDHYPIFVLLKSINTPYQRNITTAKFHTTEFISQIAEIDWNPILSITDPILHSNNLTTKLKACTRNVLA